MKIIEVTVGSNYYQQGVALRKQLFFKNFKNAQELIEDVYENQSIHVIAIENKIVIGTGRITFVNDTAIISQMTVDPNKQRNGVGSEILKKLISLSNKNNRISKIEMSARTSAILFYTKFNFKTIGDIYASKKTGIPHQSMVRLNNK